jgi:uncharacterized protein
MTTHRLNICHLKNGLSFLFVLTNAAVLFAQSDDLPTLVDPVTDHTNTLSRSEYYELRRQIIHFEDSTSNQIVILMLPTIGDNDIRDYAIRILEKNKIGQKGKDNGVLILVAKDDRKMSIEVGYGLEGVLTDAICDQIIRHEIRPRFKQGDYFNGLAAAINAIMLVTKGEYTAEETNGDVEDWIPIIFVFGVILFSVIAASRRRHYSVGSSGYRRYNDWWGSGSSGGSSFGSFGGGGGSSWSGGGGSFGGGGASGSW